MKIITSHKELEVGKYYWMLSKQFGSWYVEPCTDKYGRGEETKQLGSYWATDNNHEHLFQNYVVFGPLETPKTDTIYLCSTHGGNGFQSDCVVCAGIKR